MTVRKKKKKVKEKVAPLGAATPATATAGGRNRNSNRRRQRHGRRPRPRRAGQDECAPSAAHVDASQPPAERHGCRQCRAASQWHAGRAAAAIRAARAYSQAAVRSEPADAATLLDAAECELMGAELYATLAASAIRVCDDTARMRREPMLIAGMRVVR